MRFVALVALVALTPLCAAGCGATPDGDAAPADPERIVSLIPATTEILFSLGADDRVVGRTTWGVHPPRARAVPEVGDGIQPSVEAVLALDPDLVLLYDGAMNQASAERFRELGVEVLMLRHDTLDDLRRNILAIGELVGCEAGARTLNERVARGLDEVAAATAGRSRVRAFHLLWTDPPFTIGSGSFLQDLLEAAGGENVFADLEGPSPRVSLEAIVERDPELVLVTGSPEEERDAPELAAYHGWSAVPAVAEGRVAALDGDLVSRLGPRVAEAAWEIARALHPDLEAPAPQPLEVSCEGG